MAKKKVFCKDCEHYDYDRYYEIAFAHLNGTKIKTYGDCDIIIEKNVPSSWLGPKTVMKDCLDPRKQNKNNDCKYFEARKK